ncbi:MULTISPECIES: OpgC family protein [unclassified Bartonella]|uniref:OpgC family protein n=1 Tax=unclassified Bartonella TaxID=2645622 RepID=UPI0029056167|nr:MULTISPECIES: OpgC domain-containing protein [unclassified Bartonella]
MNKASHLTQNIAVKRDTRIDVLRALALLTIFINHVPGNIYEIFTHKNFGFSDSAEAFVLMSGIAVGLAYGNKFVPGNRLLLTLKMWKRSFTLYSAHILTTLITISIFCGAALFMHHPNLLGQINIAPIMKEPAKAVFGIVTLGHQLGYNNILSLYLVLMLAAPFMLFLARKSYALLLVVSGSLYLSSALYGIAPINYPNAGVWFLNPLSWQFLFVVGLVVTMHIKNGGKLPTHPLLVISAIGYLLLSLIWVKANLWWIDPSMGLPHRLTGFDKTYESLPRLLHVLALAYVIAIFPRISNFFRCLPTNPLAILGKYSLAVFVTGTILAMAAQVLKQVNPGGLVFDSLLIATGVVVQFTVAYYFEWLAMIKLAAKQQQTQPALADAPTTDGEVALPQPVANVLKAS